MKLFILFFTAALILSGCNATTPKNENSDKLLENNEQVVPEPEPGSDAYYLNIAKDLFVAKQYKQAYQITAGLAEKNNTEAQYLLGYLYYYGQGVPVDAVQGSKWISVSADAGYRPAIEALVLIKHGLTPDNKCSSVDLLPANEGQNAAADINVNGSNKKPLIQSGDIMTADIKTDTLKINTLKEGEVLITPKQPIPVKQEKSVEYTRSNTQWQRHTIQLVKTDSKQTTLDFAQNFKNKNPDLKDFIIIYQSKNKPHTYGVGFSTFVNVSDAKVVLKNIQSRLNDSTLFIKYLKNYTPLSAH